MRIEEVRKFFDIRKTLLSETDYEKISEILEQLEQKNYSGLREKSDAVKERGNEAFRLGDLERALELYGEAINIDPLNGAAYSNKALICAKLGRDAEGIETCERGIEVEPEFVKLYVRIGMFYMKTDNAKAHEYFAKGLEYDPKNEHLKSLHAQTKAKDASKLDKAKELLNNPALQDAVKNFVKDKSPGEIASMFKNAFGNM